MSDDQHFTRTCPTCGQACHCLKCRLGKEESDGLVLVFAAAQDLFDTSPFGDRDMAYAMLRDQVERQRKLIAKLRKQESKT